MPQAASVPRTGGRFYSTYVPRSSLIESVTGSVHTGTNTWVPNRDVHFSKEHKINSTNTVASSFTCSVNLLNQCTAEQTCGTAFAAQPADWAWDHDPLGQAVSADSPTPAFDRAYAYDSFGRRVAKVTCPNPGGAVTEATLFVNGGWNLVAEYALHNSSFILHAFRTCGHGLSGNLQGAGGVGGLLVEILPSAIFHAIGGNVLPISSINVRFVFE